MLLAYKDVSRRLWPEEAAWSAAAACSKVMPCSAMKVRNFGRGQPADAVSVLAPLVVDGPDAQVPDDLNDLEPVQDDLIGKGSRGDNERCCTGRILNRALWNGRLDQQPQPRQQQLLRQAHGEQITTSTAMAAATAASSPGRLGASALLRGELRALHVHQGTAIYSHSRGENGEVTMFRSPTQRFVFALVRAAYASLLTGGQGQDRTVDLPLMSDIPTVVPGQTRRSPGRRPQRPDPSLRSAANGPRTTRSRAKDPRRGFPCRPPECG